MARRVFIIQDDGRRDFRPAEQWGELVPMLSKDAHPDDADERAERMRSIIHSKLSSYNYVQMYDFILLTGDPVAIFLTGLALSRFGHYHRLLKYDRESGAYYPVVASVEP